MSDLYAMCPNSGFATRIPHTRLRLLYWAANKKLYKVKATIGDSVAEVEGEEKGVVAIVQALSDVVRAGQKTQNSRWTDGP